MGAETSQRKRKQPIWQFSIFADNKVGRLHELVQRLGSHDLNIIAISQLDTTECTIIRIVVAYPEDARRMLHEWSYSFTETEVLGIEMHSESSLRFVTSALVEAEINIHYLYAFIMRPRDKVGLILSVEDVDLATQVLGAHGITTLDQDDIAR